MANYHINLIKIGIIVFFLVLTSTFGLAHLPQNCTDYNPKVLMKYIVPLRNITNTSEYIPINYATCNLTVFKKKLNFDNFINSTVMHNRGDGDYDCVIPSDFPVGKYNTFYQCNNTNFITQDFGTFEVVPTDIPLSIIIYLIGISFLFLFYIVTLDKTLNVIKSLFLLFDLLIYFVVFAMVYGITNGSNGSTSLINLTQTIYIAYTYIFSFLVFIIIVMMIIRLIKISLSWKKEKANKGVMFE